MSGSCVCCRSGTGGPLCPACSRALVPPPTRGPIAGLDAVGAVAAYEGTGRALVLALKRGNRRALLDRLGRALSAAAPAAPTGAVVTWIPTTAPRRAARGVDHAELLARSTARRSGLRARPLLDRCGGDRPQQGLDGSARRHGPSFVGRRPLAGPVLVVDDVVTTGGSMGAAARALREAGATWVGGVVVAVALKAGPGGADTYNDPAAPAAG